MSSLRPCLARSALLLSVLPVGALVFGACASVPSVGPILPEIPSEQLRCRMAVSQSSPLVTEWAASEKANLEALLSTGSVAVAYSGCSMRVLPQCRLQGDYVWQRTTPSADILEIENEDELYAKLPLGAVSLEGELERSGQLSMQTYVSGHLRLDGASMADVPDEGACAQATHVVGALSVGAFALSRGGATKARAGAKAASLGEASGRVSRSAGIVRAAGDPQMCAAGTEQAPHPSCASPIQVFLWPLPGRVAEEGPPGTVQVDFVSASANGRWDVYIDDQVVCTTPCSRWVAPSRPVFLRARENSFLRSPDTIRLASLGVHPAAGAVQLQAHSTSHGKLATGITFTTFGGMATMAGIALGSVGCLAGRSEGMCTGGLISLGAGTLVTIGSIWLIVDALPRAEIVPTYRATLATLGAERPVELRIGPGFAFGRF